MIVRRKTRKDIIAISREEIAEVIRRIYPSFLRFNENNEDLFLELQDKEFFSSADFGVYIKSRLKSVGDERLLLLGNSSEEISKIKMISR